MFKVKRQKKIHPMLLTAKLISSIFHPVYYPLMFLTLLFFSTFLEYFSVQGMIFIFCLTAMFTIVIPGFLTTIYRKLFHIKPQSFLNRHGRYVPYLIHLLCYNILLHLLQRFQVHGMVLDVVIVSILVQICCTSVNCFWKVSMHAAGAGGIIGYIIAQGALMDITPIFPVIISILVCGLVSSCRLVLRRHTLAQVNVGALIGILCGIVGTWLSSYRGLF